MRARVVVNATGPWSDAIERMADAQARRRCARQQGGARERAARARRQPSAVTLTAPQDGRVMFVLPVGLLHDHRHDRHATTRRIPTTCARRVADVTYLLDAANPYFPDAHLTERDVVSAWAGIRPLAAHGATGAPSSASREHSIVESTPGLVRVTGGKLTTYRVDGGGDRGLRASGCSADRRRRAARRRSRSPAATFAMRRRRSRTRWRRPATKTIARRLVLAYGTAWHGVWSLTQADPALAAAVEPGLPYLHAELLHAVTHEQAATLGDLLIRRTPVAFETPDHGRSAARRIAPTWSDGGCGGATSRSTTRWWTTTRRACASSAWPTPRGRPPGDRGWS